MDDIVRLLAEGVARAARGSRPPSTAPLPTPARPAPRRTARPPAASPPMRPSSAPGVDPFAEAASAGAAFAGPPDVPHPLLAAFRGGGPLLAAVVLSEALAPPLSLQPLEQRRR